MRPHPFLTRLLISTLSSISISAHAGDDPCTGPNALLNVINRPTAADSACVIPYKHVALEAGAEALQLIGTGYAQNYPEGEIRIGLPYHNELDILLPLYIHQTVQPHSGFTGTGITLKHTLGYSSHWVSAIEGDLIFPSGSYAFGSSGYGGVVNGILDYIISPQLSFTTAFGMSIYSSPNSIGGHHYLSLNPDCILAWQPNDITSLYVEAYGATSSGPGIGGGENIDVGVIYLLHPKLTVDAEIGRRIGGNYGGFDQYIGAGFALLI